MHVDQYFALFRIWPLRTKSKDMDGTSIHIGYIHNTRAGTMRGDVQNQEQSY